MVKVLAFLRIVLLLVQFLHLLLIFGCFLWFSHHFVDVDEDVCFFHFWIECISITTLDML